MLFRTFQLIPGVGPWREKDLWARGVMTWDDLPPEGGAPVVSEELDAELRATIADARAALVGGDLRTLVSLLPGREHWRLYPHFADRAVYFDIEADGDRVPTVVTLFDRQGIRTFIRGRNLEELPTALGESEVWVTFNGGSFDIPVLKAYFGELPEPVLHLDLKVLVRKLRLGGGLKPVEDAIGIGRPPHLRGVGGLQAVELWRVYEDTADLAALRLLVEYNAYDAINLRSVAEIGFNRLADQLAFDDSMPVFERGEVLYDLTKLLLALGHTDRDRVLLARLAPQDRQLDG